VFDPCPDYVLIVEPGPGLIHSLSNEVRWECLFELFLVLKRIVILSVRHRATIKPRIEHVRDPVHHFATFLARKSHLIDDVFVEVLHLLPGQ
jgi:hypothetical protein